jgi:asparagine synthase (glutamine-hydrolysing)
MCGIFALLNKPEQMDNDFIKTQFMKGKRRGPEDWCIKYLPDTLNTSDELKCTLGFHRLAINGLNKQSNQPLVFENKAILICNGEIYNYKELYQRMKVTPTTDSDCEVIIHLYLKYGIEQTLIMLDGVFAFVLVDLEQPKMYVARDPLGVRPLYKLYQHAPQTKFPLYGFASELKCLEQIYNNCNSGNDYVTYLEQFPPGTYTVFNDSNIVGIKFDVDGCHGTHHSHIWHPTIINKTYYTPTFSHSENAIPYCMSAYLNNIQSYLEDAVIKRCITTERPVACLLSGGIDSCLIASLVAKYFRELDHPKQIETYTIGLKGSEDMKYAKIMAEHIGSKHTEVIVTEEEMISAIPEVIRAIESYDTTTVRASIGNYLVGKYISEHSDAKVIFNGDGSDELFGGYLYMNKCPDDIEFDKETRRLLKDIHLFDVLRSDKSISSNGLEPRTPFLDRSFVNYVLSIPAFIRNHNNLKDMEKMLLRQSFSGTNLLPEVILFRRKEAFSDGVSSHGRSLFSILQEFISNYYAHENLQLSPIEMEKKYYKDIFENEFPNCQHIVPYLWMPKYTNATDPSARTLTIYNSDTL